jgi:ribose 5-phosphate isomerase B
MKVAVASDHRGVRVKSQILNQITEMGYEGIDCGPSDTSSVDYPDFASRVSKMVSEGQVNRGILICGTGMGMCITANKFRGVRAIICHDDVAAEMSRRHNDANIMCLSADLMGDRVLSRVVDIWLKTEFEGGRHQRRLEKIAEIEKSICDGGSVPNDGPGCCN